MDTGVVIIIIIITSFFYESFTINYTITCNNIQFIFICGLPFTHIHHVHNLQTLTFIHTLIHIHNHTQDKCSKYSKIPPKNGVQGKPVYSCSSKLPIISKFTFKTIQPLEPI